MGILFKDCYLTMNEQNIREIRKVTLSFGPPFTSLSAENPGRGGGGSSHITH
jgi:hypothetical protein